MNRYIAALLLYSRRSVGANDLYAVCLTTSLVSVTVQQICNYRTGKRQNIAPG